METKERGPGGTLTPAEGPGLVAAPEPSVPSFATLLALLPTGS